MPEKLQRLEAENRELKAQLAALQQENAQLRLLEAERQLREREEQLRVITDAMPALIAYVDQEQRYRFNNRAYETWFGYSPSTLNGRPVKEVLGKAAYEAVRPHLQAALAGQEVSYEQSLPYESGGVRYIQAHYVPDFDERGEVRGYVSLVYDISERKRVEGEIVRLNQDLRRRVTELQTLLDLLPIGVCVAHDPACLEMTINPAGARMLNISVSDNPSKSGPHSEQLPFKILQDGVEVAPHELPIQYAAAHNISIRDVEYDIVHADGQVVTLLEYASPLHDEQGRVTGCLGVFVDVSHLKQVEQALRESEARFRMMADTAPVIIWISDTNKQSIYVNQPGLDFMGRTLEQEAGLGWVETMYPDDRQRCLDIYTRAFEARQPFEVEYRLRRADGEYRWIVNKGVPRFEGDHFMGYIGSCVDIDQHKRAEEGQRLLAEAGKILAGSLNYTDQLSSVARLAVPNLADWCAVDLFEEDWSVRHVAVAHVDPAKVELAHKLQLRYPPRQEELAKESQPWQQGRSELYPEITEAMLETAARDAEHFQILRDLNLRSAIVTPLVTRERVLGLMLFVWAESERRYDERDLALAEELARRAATALDNARLYTAEQQARWEAEEAAERITGLQAVTAALSRALTQADVIEVIIRHCISVLEASGGAVMLLTEDGESLEIIQAIGYSEAGTEAFRRFPLTASVPASDAVRTSQPVWLTSHHDFEARYPHLASIRPPDSHTEGVAVVPLLLQDQALGAIAVSFDKVREFNPEDKDFLLTLAGQCAQALERTHLYEAERRARAEAETAGERLSLLVAASEILIASPDYEITLPNLARLIVSSLADWCVVDVVGEDGLIHRLAVVHRDPARAELAAELQHRYPAIDPQGEHTIAKTLRRGQSWFDPAMSETRLVAEARDAEHLRLLRGLGFASEIVVPLIARGRNLGALTLVKAARDRGFETADLTLAELLARRAALSVDNARLYREAQQLNAQLEQRVARRTAELQETNLKLENEIAERQRAQAELTELQRRLMEGREAERLYLARELHDGPVQELYGVVYSLSDLAQSVDGEANQASFKTARELVQRVIRELRSMAGELRPPTLAPFGLEKAISSHVDQFQQLHPELEVQLELMPDGTTLPEPMRLALFRIYQAALNNVARHAGAGKVIVRFNFDAKQLTLEIEDNGFGFEVPQRWIELARQGHLGLVGMVERAEAMGGQLIVQSTPGQGALVRAIVPRQ